MNAFRVLRSDAGPDTSLPGVALQVLCGLAWLGVAWSFAFLDRGRGGFAFFAWAWALVGLVGFGLGVRMRAHPERARRMAMVLTVLAALLTLFPGFLMFVLVRWAAFGLLLVTAARAAAMQTRRDLYYALAAIVAVSLLVVTHANAQWTIWFYLAPAWLCIALALAWDYAADVRLGAPVKAGFTLGFLALCIALGAALSALLPVPQLQGFGFMEPGTANPGRVSLPVGAEGGTGGRASKAGTGATGARPEPGADGREAGRHMLLGDIVDGLHRSLRDSGLPQWQRGIVAAMLGAAEALGRVTDSRDPRVAVRPMTPAEREQARARAQAVAAFLSALLDLLWLALAALAAWLLRWRIATAAVMGGAWLLAGWLPGPSMRCSMLALRWTLRRRGHPLQPSQSVLEHVDSVPFLPPLAHGWLREAAQTYGAWRFGDARATGAQARRVRQVIAVTAEMIRTRRTA